MKLLIFRAMIILFMFSFLPSCQKEITGNDPAPPPNSKNCKPTQISNLEWWSSTPEDSTMFSKIQYDSAGRISQVINPVNDTTRFSYSSNEIVINIQYTAETGTGPLTYDYKEKYSLNSSGVATYRLTTLFDDQWLVDSTYYRYNPGGQLQQLEFYDFMAGENAAVNYIFANGNIQKAIYSNATSYHPDSIVFKYSAEITPSEILDVLFYDKYQHGNFYPWTGRQNKNLVIEKTYYYAWGTDAFRTSYDLDTNGFPSVIRSKRYSTGQWRDNGASFLKFTCN